MRNKKEEKKGKNDVRMSVPALRLGRK